MVHTPPGFRVLAGPDLFPGQALNPCLAEHVLNSRHAKAGSYHELELGRVARRLAAARSNGSGTGQEEGKCRYRLNYR